MPVGLRNRYRCPASVRSSTPVRASTSETESPRELATHSRPPATARAAGLSNPYRGPASTRITRPVAALISVTASPASLATHSAPPAAARAAGSLSR
jgi:hypothetical protein